MQAIISVLLVDDQVIMLDGLEALFAQEPTLRVVGRAQNGREAVALAAALRPDVVIMDISMPEMDGIEATRGVLKASITSRVLVLSMYNNKEFVRELLAAGASGYLLKNAGRAELLVAIRDVAAGLTYVAEAVRQTMEQGTKGAARAGDKQNQVLTTREKEIVIHIARGESGKEIADRLSLSVDTVNTHRKNILHKLDLPSSASLVRYALERGWNH